MILEFCVSFVVTIIRWRVFLICRDEYVNIIQACLTRKQGRRIFLEY